MMVIYHGSLANSKESYFHKVGLCHSDQSWEFCDDDDYCDEDDDNDECDECDDVDIGVDIGVDLVNPASSRSQIGVHCRQARLK